MYRFWTAAKVRLKCQANKPLIINSLDIGRLRQLSVFEHSLSGCVQNGDGCPMSTGERRYFLKIR